MPVAVSRTIQAFIAVFLLVIISNLSFAQNLNRLNKNSSSTGKEASFYDVQKEMNDFWDSQNVKDGYVFENGIKSKMPNWKLYKRWEYYWEQRVDQKTGEFPTTTSVDEYQKYLKTHSNLKKTTANENWVNLGTNSSTGGYAGLGRINCIAFHPIDANTFWVGSPSGGIWKTTTGGTSWTILNNNQSVIGVSAIVIPSDYTTSNTIYIATGDRDGGSLSSLSGGQGADNASVGVLKSTDGGVNWNNTDLTYTASQKKLVYSLVIHPSNNSILFAATSDGIYKTTDGGTIWNRKNVNAWNDIEFKPGDPTIMYATNLINYGSTYMVRSTDSGETWSFFVVASSGRRGEIAVTPDDPNVVYLFAANSGGGVDGVYKSTDSGASFSKVNTNSVTEPGMLGYYTDGRAPATGQGSYDWCIAASPSDANTVFIGGITTWKSIDGGATWTANNNWTSSATYNISGKPIVHADKHTLVYQNSTTLFEGNDGGIYKTINGGTSWTDLSDGLVISQIYRIGVSQTDANVILTGLQDNGSKKYIGGSSTWFDATGGDGMECVIDFNNATSYMYATYHSGTIYRNSNGFSTTARTTISDNIGSTIADRTGAWVTPYIMDPTNSAILYAGYLKVWKTADRGNNWTAISQELSPSDKLRSLAIAPSNSNYLYAADRTNMWRTKDGGATNWSTITLPTTSNYVTYIAVKNNDPNTVWITYGGFTDGAKVYQSIDGGANWTNISTGLPNLPVMCIVQYKDLTDRNVLFVGTDVGVYIKDGANAWESYSTGLPNVVVTELEIYYASGTDKLRAGTYGRGLWETDINAPLPVELTSFSGSVKDNSVLLKWTTATEVANYGFEVERSEILNEVKNFNGTSWEKIGFVNGNGTSNSPKNYSYEDRDVQSGDYLYRLKQIDINGQYEYSETIEVFAESIPGRFALEQNYPNPFNPTTKIKYSIPEDGIVSIRVFDVLGREINTLVNQKQLKGDYSVEFDASSLSSGMYIYQLRMNEFVQTKKMILLR
ncbi:MAG: T9SS type A sorting domain-containing protein [bacterium]